MRNLIWNIKKNLFNVRVKWSNRVTADFFFLLICWIMFKFSHFITRKIDNYLIHFRRRNRQSESVIIVWENSEDPLCHLQNFQYRLLSLCETFCFAAMPTYRFTSTQYNSHPIQYAAVSQPNINEIPSTKFPVRSVNELQTDGYTTAGRIAERIVRWCSSVIVQQQYTYLRHLPSNISQQSYNRIIYFFCYFVQ